MRWLADVHPDERGATIWATITVFLVLVAHSMLETARDALFLSHLPASHLPWVYLVLAGLALAATRLFSGSAAPQQHAEKLILLQIAAATGNLALLFLLSETKPAAALYALYVWGGLASTLILLRFWLMLSDRFTPTQAKRVFPVIAAGPLLGSLVGYGLAGVTARYMAPRYLLGVSAAVFLLSAGASYLMARAQACRASDDAATVIARPAHEELSIRESISLALRHNYMRRVALLLLVASVTVTLGDFIFKTVVAREISPAQLGSFLAASYFLFDLLALLLLFTAVVPFVRARGVTEALALQPVLLFGGGVLLTITGGLAAVLCLRGVDGVLRWSLHKTATELLYVPLSPRLRSAVKAVSDILAHRGGQALASLLILGWLAIAPSERLIGPILIACTMAWIYLALSLRQPYLDLFRETLGEGAIAMQIDFPELDMASLETLIAALSSPDDGKVTAAMSLLHETGRTHLIPALVLYHPSPPVVLRALDLFTQARRDDFLQNAKYLLHHADDSVRAATMRACSLLQPDVDLLRQAAASDSAPVAVTALVALTAAGHLDVPTFDARLGPYLEANPGDDVTRSLALALRDNAIPAFAPLMERLLGVADIATRREAIVAIGTLGDAAHLPLLLRQLATRELRAPTRRALLLFGDVGLEHLTNALHDPTLPRSVRIHLPRTLSRFGNQAAADTLLAALLSEPTGMVRYKILRGLGHLIANAPTLNVDPTLIDRVVDEQVRTIAQNLQWRVTLEQGAVEQPARRTTGYQLLVDLLAQKEGLAVERLFRALGLRYRDEDWSKLYDGRRSPDARTRSSSGELLHDLLGPTLRGVVVDLTEDQPLELRLAATRTYLDAEPLAYDALLLRLVEDPSVSVCCVASYHAAELDLRDIRAPLEARAIDPTEWLGGLRQKSLAMVSGVTSAIAERFSHEA